MDREAFDKLADADRQWLVIELLTGIMGRVDDTNEMVLAKLAHAFPEPQGSA
jgi:hypothetical protein